MLEPKGLGGTPSEIEPLVDEASVLKQVKELLSERSSLGRRIAEDLSTFHKQPVELRAALSK